MVTGQQQMTEQLNRERSAPLQQVTSSPKAINQGRSNKWHKDWLGLRKGRGAACRKPRHSGFSAMFAAMSSASFNALPGLRGRIVPQQTNPVQRRSLPFHELTPFESVREQFADCGIVFEGAIALAPSNPSFYSRIPRVVLMPIAHRHAITITLKSRLPRITLKVRGYKDIRLTALDGSGHCLAHCKTFRYRYAETHKAPLEELTIEGRRASGLILESSAPFVLEALSF
jgi:hypothetical protein